MMAHQQQAVERYRDECRAFLDNVKAHSGMTVQVVNVEEQERVSPFGDGSDVEVAFYVVVKVAE